MSPLPRSTRFAFWLALFALLLKAAVPMLAVASAQAQGKTLVEVCTVYGMATVALESGNPQPLPDSGATHHGDHCALTAMAALAFGSDAPVRVAAPAAGQMAVLPLPARPSERPDACAIWIACRHHGPPSIA